jgi:DNA processing protein
MQNPAGPEAAKVLSALGSIPTAVDELVRRCQVSAAAVAEVLLALELEGRLERHRGNRVSLM